MLNFNTVLNSHRRHGHLFTAFDFITPDDVVVTLCIQGSHSAYCSPRINLPNLGDYETLEIESQIDGAPATLADIFAMLGLRTRNDISLPQKTNPIGWVTMSNIEMIFDHLLTCTVLKPL